MKAKFSKKWIKSKQPRKQRKYKAQAPLHVKQKFVGVNLSKELRKKHKKRNIALRKGDVVKVMRGKYKKKQGKVTQVLLKMSKVIVEGIQVKKQEGSKVNVKLQPSNLQIITLNLEDRKRAKKLGTEVQKKKEEPKKVEVKKDEKENVEKSKPKQEKKK